MGDRSSKAAPRTLLGLAAWLAVAATSGHAAEVDCLIAPLRSVTLAASTEGVVEAVLVDRGDFVEEGQVVARLESSAERASVEFARVRSQARGQILSSKARLDFATRSLERQRNLEQKDVVSKKEMDEAMSQQQVAQAQLQEAQEAQQEAAVELKRSEALLARREVKSPIGGVVVERMLSPGEYADPPEIVRLAQIDPLRVEVFAPLGLYGKIESGMQAEILPEQPVGGRHTAKVTVVDRVIDPASATFGVRLELPNPGLALPAGVNCRVRFPVDAPELADSPGRLPSASAAVRMRSLVAIESSAARDPGLAVPTATPLTPPLLVEPSDDDDAQALAAVEPAPLPEAPEPTPEPLEAGAAAPAEPAAQSEPEPAPEIEPEAGAAETEPAAADAQSEPEPAPEIEPEASTAETEPAAADAQSAPEPAPEIEPEAGAAETEPAAAEREPAAAPQPKAQAPPAPPPRLVSVRVSAEPGSRIEVDGKGVGSAPLDELRVPAGRRRFVARLPDGSVLQRTVDVESGGEVVRF